MASMVQWDIDWHEQATAALKFQVLQLFLNCTVRFEREKKTRLVLYCVEILSSERRNAASRLTLPDAAGTRSRRFAPVTDVGAARCDEAAPRALPSEAVLLAVRRRLRCRRQWPRRSVVDVAIS